MRSQNGQSLIELIIALGIFVIVIASFTLFILDSYVAGRLANEITKANFLAEEGLEAVISIRDNSWDSLTVGNHGLAISGNNWVLQGTSEDISDQLREGIRVIRVDDIEPDRKKITSQISWQFSEGRTEEVKLITYLTNWQKISIGYCRGICTPCENFGDRTTCNAQGGCSWSAKLKKCTGTCTPCDTFLDQDSCQTQSGCFWNWE